MTTNLPEGFIVRVPTMDDIPAVVDLMRSEELAQYGESGFSEDLLRARWSQAGADLAAYARLVFAPQGLLVGYASIRATNPVHFYTSLKVRSQYAGMGIGRYLLQWAEARAREDISKAPEGTRIVMALWGDRDNAVERERLEQAGFVAVRTTWRMEIELEALPAEPVWPEGIVVRTFVPGQDEYALFQAMDEAFTDHWGHVPGNYEEWLPMVKRSSFDPSLCFIACEGDEIAAGCICIYKQQNHTGYVDDLAVRRQWRKKGVGMALLQQAFRVFYQRGVKRVALDVDSQNLTGATRLYQRAGMHIVRQQDTYEKELRPGRELSTQALES